MKSQILKIAATLGGLFITIVTIAQQRFPRPDFESDYTSPTLETPEPRYGMLEYFDVFVLFIVLSLTTWLILKKRSRKGVMYVSLFSLIYFGFYREGCICSIGAIQNVALSMTDSTYAISISALAFFMLPLLFALFAGRVFCGGACPLGAIQDLIILKPIELPVGVRKALGLIPYVYLGLAILFAVTKTDFIICRYDPFVGFFRMDAKFNMLVLGGSLLIIGVFVGRPYCRFLCPYGVLLGWMSGVSKKHLTITPGECIDCKLCERSCPMDAINKPVTEPVSAKKDIRRFILSMVAIPLWMLIGGYLISSSHVYLSKANRTVALAELLIAHPELKSDLTHIDVQTFLSSGQSMEELKKEASAIRQQFYTGGWILGASLGLAFGIIFTRKTIYRQRKDYVPDRVNCVSCARCMSFCPVGKEITVNPSPQITAS
jgi:NosR/NirI family transcriptional regulator, nitrous oxide reductase regulator